VAIVIGVNPPESITNLIPACALCGDGFIRDEICGVVVGAVVVIEMARPLLAAGNNINPATRINADTAVVMRTLDDFFINLAVC
jgi:hypothetical protein